MILFVGVAVGLLTVVVAGGDLRRIGTVTLRRVPLLLGAVVLQGLVLGWDGLATGVAVTGHLVSYALAIGFVLANRSLPGLWVVLLGGLLNLAAIVANGGVMPASAWAVRVAGLEDAEGFSNSEVVEDARLAPLGDVMAIPEGVPLANVFSIGDVVLVVGVTITLHELAGSRWTARRARTAEG